MSVPKLRPISSSTISNNHALYMMHDHIPFYRYEEERVKCMDFNFLKIALSVTFVDFKNFRQLKNNRKSGGIALIAFLVSNDE